MKRVRMILGTVLLLNCGPDDLPKNPLEYFDEPVLLTSTKVKLDKELHGYAGVHMAYDHPYLVASEVNKLHNKLLFLVDLEQKTLKKFLNYGPGDCENSHADPFYLNADKKELLIADYVKDEFRKINLDSLKFGKSSYEYCPPKYSLLENRIMKNFFDVKPIDDQVFLGYRDELTDSMYSLYNVKEEWAKHFLTFPNLDEFPQDERKMASGIFTGDVYVAPNRKQVALVAAPSLIDILSYENGELHRKKQMEFYRYKFRVLKKYGWASRAGFNNTVGFVAGGVTNLYIYVVYDGQDDKAWENISTIKRESHLLVFDWEGNPMKYFKLDRHVMEFVVKEDDSGIYTISRDGGGPELLQYDFNI